MPLGLLVVLAAVIAVVAAGAYTRGWEWTGFLGKTLWDWMKLLIVPIILALGGILITQMDRLNSSRAQQLDRERLELARVQTQQQTENARREFEITRRGQVTERFTQAIDKLGSESVEVRLGGIYSLEWTAQEDRIYHWPIMEVLTTYIRTRAPRKRERDAEHAYPDPDIQAILTVIGRRSKYHRELEYGHIDLHATDLKLAVLSGANLSGANLSDANLSEADLSEANLRGATLTNADLTGTLLAAATMPDGQKYEDWLKSKDREEDGENGGSP
jgi:hypothetical protein